MSTVGNTCRACRRSAEEHGLTFDVALPDHAVFVDADPVRISQIVNNLLSNAIKFTREGGTISVELRDLDGEAVIRVRDTGAGIPKEMREKVFEMFTQVDRQSGSQNGGLGIGLALSKRLVEMHNGTISVDSRRSGSRK